MRILLTGGGTGGHITPILAVVEKIKKQAKQEVEFLFIGSADDNSSVLLESKDIKVKNVLCGKLRRYFSFRNFIDIFKVPFGIFQAMRHVYIFMPDICFTKGGFASVPGAAAAWIFRIPIISHESDTVPGLANKIIGKLAKIIIVSFQKPLEYFPKKKTILLGNPIREEIIQGSAEKFREEFAILSDKPVIYITAGSQGAIFINAAILSILSQLLEFAEVIHQCGKTDFENVKKIAAEIAGGDFEKKGYHPRDFIGGELPDIFAAASLIITRAGANTLAEIAAAGKPSIIIPLSGSAGNHQMENAFEFSKAGAAILIEQENLSPNLFLLEIKKILKDAGLSAMMSENVKKLSHPEAADKIAEVILSMPHP